MKPSHHLFMRVLMATAACFVDTAWSQTLTAVSASYTGPAAGRTASFNYVGNGLPNPSGITSFRFDPKLGPDGGRIVNGQYQIHNGTSGPPLFLNVWADCPSGPFSGDVVTLIGTRRITCGWVSVSVIEFAFRITVSDTGNNPLANMTGNLARFVFDIPASAPSGAVALNIANASFSTSIASGLSGTVNNGLLSITVPPIPPALAYAPLPGSTIGFPSGPLGSPSSLAIDVTASGGQGGATVTLACSPPPQGISVVPGTQTVGLGGAATDLTVSCVRGTSLISGTLNCTETSSAGGSPVPRSWPLSCPAGTVPDAPPILAYNPSAGSTVTLSAGAPGQTATAGIGVTASSAGSGNGNVALACTASAGFVLTGGNQSIAVGATPNPIGLSCVRGASLAAGTLNCTETDTPGGAQRARQWPLACPAGLAPQYSSNPRPNSVLASYRSLNQDFVAATLAVTNTGNATLNLSNCTFAPAGGFGLAGPTTLLAGQAGTLTLSCGTPAIGTTLSTFLSCQTNDPGLATVLYRADCVAPPLANAGAGASPLPRLSSPIADPGALLGTAISMATTTQGAEVVAVGAPNGGGDGNGRVYVFVRAPSAVSKRDDPNHESLGAPVAVLEPPARAKRKGAVGDKFGSAVSVAPGGDAIAVGAPAGGLGEAGGVLIYPQPPGGWGDLGNLTPIAIDPPGLIGVDDFGASVQFDVAGVLVVGAPASDVGGATDSGAAFVFRFDGGSWPQVGPTLTSPGAPAGAAFGSAIDAEGGRLAIGAPGEAAQAGAVYTYGVDATGASGATRITAAGGEPGDKWGSSLSVGGGLLAVGAPGDDTAAGSDSGSVSLFALGAAGAPQFASLLMPEAGAGQAAGTSVATNGNVVLVGAPLADGSAGNDTGRAYAYALPDRLAPMETADGFYENTIGGAGDRFGSALAIGSRRAVVGAPLGNEGNEPDEGRADPFLLDGIFRSGVER